MLSWDRWTEADIPLYAGPMTSHEVPQLAEVLADYENVTVYLSGAVSQNLLPHAGRGDLGILVTPDTKGLAKHVPAFGGLFAADNACFSQAKAFDPERWTRWLATVDPSTCLFATVPDVVGDHAATVERSAEYYEVVRSFGHKAAFVAQNGATVENVPWDSFDALFIGGVTECVPCAYTRPAAEWQIKRCPSCGERLTEWKVSEAVVALIDEAHRRGMWVHVGRVNSAKRYNWCVEVGADSADGTMVKFGPSTMVPKLISWLDAASESRVAA